MNPFGNNVARLRSDKGLSQRQLAALIGVSGGTVAAWESRNTLPNWNTLQRLSEVFVVPVSSLFADGAFAPQGLQTKHYQVGLTRPTQPEQGLYADKAGKEEVEEMGWTDPQGRELTDREMLERVYGAENVGPNCELTCPHSFIWAIRTMSQNRWFEELAEHEDDEAEREAILHDRDYVKDMRASCLAGGPPMQVLMKNIESRTVLREALLWMHVR